MLRPVWKPEDAHEVFERVATFHATQSAADVTVEESGLVIR